ncbi:MAG: GDP-mannose 4,6-dehydratase [bacterium]|nr:GDP-mannose 4,6-dehydratase [bacterium]
MILFLKPYFEKKPWAGKELNKIYDCPESTGEAWIISGYRGKSSVIANGKFKGQTLRHLWVKHPELFGNYPDKEFPLLLKLISSSSNLSVQVHPNDDYALKMCNSLGKFECWYILPETTAKTVTLGIDLKNSREMLEMIQRGLVEKFLIEKPINPGNLVIVEPGTVHAIHGDTFILEVQESSDLTYRIFDYYESVNRKLNLVDALNVINYNTQKNQIHDFKDENTFKNSHFNVYKLFISEKTEYENKGFELFYVIDGCGSINNTKIKKGDSFILTADSEKIIFDGNLEVIAVIPKPKDKERLKMRKIALITGITNQDGYYLTKLLLEKDYEVHGIIKSMSKLSSDYLVEFLDNPNFFGHIGDLTDASNINRIIETVKPDEIYHIASQSHVDVSFEMPEYTTEVNSLGTLRLLDSIKNSDFKTKMFNLCSPYVFSGEMYPQDETTPFEPRSPYAVTKVYSYYMARCYRENNNMFVTNGICYNHESPMRECVFVAKKITEFAKMVKKGRRKILELGNLDAKREWGHAKDYAYAMWLCLQQDKPNDYVISTGKAYTVREFIEKTYSKIGIDIEWNGSGLDEVGINSKTKEILVRINPKFIRPNDVKTLVGDSKKFINDTNFKFEYDIDKLIDSLLEG